MALLQKSLRVLPAELVLLLGLWVLPSPVPAQEPHHRPSRLAGAEDVQLTVLVDGSINPEMIPEDVA